ncbi:alpha/beta fold hydrolase [Vreelandella andesensis]|uniref:Alpha/beta fold hydrolase n=1 Tax=Vreelandella andesensis TaxID=447567 RepID=A0A3S0XX59_9GAMM|nr:alpha/beta fold hydrolase [Halomonas andesensis]RUR26642.1 alpha/beta fold hydrolase [Halomonas andesensis]
MSYYADSGFVDIPPGGLSDALAKPAAQRFLVTGHGPLSVVGLPKVGRIMLAHGAGAGHCSTFMRQFAATLAAQGVQVLAIDFPYMQQINEQGKRRPPPPIKQTVADFASWYSLIAPLSEQPLWVGGKSMGGRVATLFASELLCHEMHCQGVIVAGYPFHPPRKPDKLRIGHFPAIRCPVHILQGERDLFGNVGEVLGYHLPNNIHVAWLADGDHDFKPRRISGLNQQVLIDEAAILAASFVRA